MELHRIATGDIEIVGTRRDADADKVSALAESMKAIGLQTPISVWTPDDGETVRLVAGRHRLEAARLLGWDRIDCMVVNLSDLDRRMWDISENLHRAELTVTERAECIAEWLRLVEQRQTAQVAPNESKRTDGRGHRPQGGVNAATRELGIDRTEAHRAVKIDALPEEVKAEARVLHLEDNQTALLKATKQPTKEDQLRALREHSVMRSAPKPQSLARDPLNDFETVEKQMDAVIAAWNRAGPEARERLRTSGIFDEPVADNTAALRSIG